MEKDAEGVHPDHVPEGKTGVLRLIDAGGDCGEGADQGYGAQRLLAATLVEDGFQDHDEHSEDGENYFGKNANVIRGMGQRLRQCGIHWPTTLPTVCANGTRAV